MTIARLPELPRRSRVRQASRKNRWGMNFMNFASAGAGFAMGENREE
jgi:hypothetical protein